MRGLRDCHPAVAAVYFALMIGATMLFQNPVFLLLSLLWGGGCAAMLAGGRRFLRGLPFSLLFFLLAGLSNPLFVHEGLTVLFYLNGQPVTWEAVCRGLAGAAMLLAVLWWFQALDAALPPDRMLGLFGSAAPALALVLSMTFRLIPRMKERYRVIRDAQRANGAALEGNWLFRAREAVRELSILVTWSLESGVDTADSMRARGYALRGKTHYRDFRFLPADGILLSVLLLLGGAVFFCGGRFVYYPVMTTLTASSFWGAAAFSLLGVLPFLLRGWEAWRWRRAMRGA